jgi:hypothetical protein
MAGGRIVQAPDGERWRVKRRWSNRSLPKLKGRWRGRNGEWAAEAGLETAFSALDSIVVAVVGGIVIALVVFVLLPLIGIALELILLFLLITSGILGRVVLRRPWIVEATNLDDPEGSVTFPVKGWRRSGEAIDELASTIPATGLPTELRHGTHPKTA